MIRNLSLFIIMVLFGSASFAADDMDAFRLKLIKVAQENFWGNAVGMDGKKLVPASEKERKSLLISEKDAKKIVDAGLLSGMADACKLNWQQHFEALMANERRRGRSEKQMAFAGVLHGVAQGTMKANVKCDNQLKQQVVTQINAHIQQLQEKRND